MSPAPHLDYQKLSIIVPVYNERETVEEAVRRALDVEISLEKEVIVIDDGSTDGTRQVMEQMNDPRVKLIIHEHNAGKGEAFRTGLEAATGDVLVIQDADLEYDPEDWPALLRPIMKGVSEVVYGNRFAGPHSDMMFWHWIGNKFLSLITNILYNTTLQDMETCYKMFTRRAIEGVRLRAERFEMEPELTAKFLKRGFRIYEVPISYAGRDYSQGKKITWRDGIVALWTLLRYRFVD